MTEIDASPELACLRFRKGQARVLRAIALRPELKRIPKTAAFFAMAAEAAQTKTVLEVAGVPAYASLKRVRNLATACEVHGAARPAVILPDCLAGLGL